MSTTIPINTMPALGVQLASMADCLGVCHDMFPSQEEGVLSWKRARDDVFIPFEIESDALPGDRFEARKKLVVIAPQVRERFDGRINRLYQQSVTKAVIDEQEIDVDQVRRARDMDLISELPANALIQSALTFEAGKAVQAASPSVPLLMANVGTGILYGVIMTYILFSEDLSMSGINSAILPIRWSLVLIYSAGRVNHLHKVKDAFAERWREIFPDKKS